ncbi:MAG: PorT family protein [Salinivirgaceae bacterium]|nr:PorT family protein [Salinivirgaceae bacterium]
MKRTFFIIAILISIFSLAQAQNIRMGISASPQASWFTSDVASIESEGAQAGFSFGLITDFFFTERYSFSTGIMINNTGGTLSYADSLDFKASDKVYNLGEKSTIKYKIQYVDIPLTFKMESNKIGYFKYYAQFGVINQIRVGASANITDDTQDFSGVGCKDEVGLFHMGYTIGTGALYYFSKNTAISLGASYSNGFIDITSNKNKDVEDKTTLKNLSLSVGLLF